MAKIIFSQTWQINQRTKCIDKKLFPPKKCKYGSVRYIDNSIINYDLPYLTLIEISLYEEIIPQLTKKVSYNTFNITNVRLIYGYLGFLTIEVYGNIKDDACNTTSFSQLEDDMAYLAVSLSGETTMLDKIISETNEFLYGNSSFYYNQHNIIRKKLETFPGYYDSEELDRYIYFYHIFSDNINEIEQLKSYISFTDDHPFEANGHKAWQRFATHLWQTNKDVDSDEMHKLSFLTIAAAWEVLIYDVGTINYNYLLRFISEQNFSDEKVIREIINNDNNLIQEVSLTIRDQSTAQLDLMTRCRKEYKYEERKDLFEKSQFSLKYATEGIENGKQTKYSQLTHIVLTVLTAMSVYSVICDAFSLLTAPSDNAFSPNLISSLLFSIATLIMLLVFWLVIKNDKNN